VVSLQCDGQLDQALSQRFRVHAANHPKRGNGMPSWHIRV
jgi:hypothetical protein